MYVTNLTLAENSLSGCSSSNVFDETSFELRFHATCFNLLPIARNESKILKHILNEYSMGDIKLTYQLPLSLHIACPQTIH